MHKKIISVLCGLILMTACGCENKTDAEIRIPIYDNSAGTSYKTAEVEKRDFSQTKSIGANVEYAFADTLKIEHDTNLISYNVKKNEALKEGDVIAVFDSSALDYDYQNQKILADSAYSRYASSGSEASRLEYEEEAKKLELIQYEIDRYTIKAPYDCIICSVNNLQTGSAVSAGTEVCKIAKPDEVCIVVNDSKDSFAFGMDVGIKFGTNEVYNGEVVQAEGKNDRSSVIIRFKDNEYDRVQKDVGNISASGWATVIAKVFNKHDALCIPAEAIMQYSGTTYCYIESNGERARVQIETGDTVDGYTIILSGLSEGDIVSYT